MGGFQQPPGLGPIADALGGEGPRHELDGLPVLGVDVAALQGVAGFDHLPRLGQRPPGRRGGQRQQRRQPGPPAPRSGGPPDAGQGGRLAAAADPRLLVLLSAVARRREAAARDIDLAIEPEPDAANGADDLAAGAEGGPQPVDDLGQRLVGGRRLTLPQAGEDRLAGHHRPARFTEQQQELVDPALAGDLAALDPDHLPSGIDLDLREPIAHGLRIGREPARTATRAAN